MPNRFAISFADLWEKDSNSSSDVRGRRRKRATVTADPRLILAVNVQVTPDALRIVGTLLNDAADKCIPEIRKSNRPGTCKIKK